MARKVFFPQVGGYGDGILVQWNGTPEGLEEWARDAEKAANGLVRLGPPPRGVISIVRTAAFLDAKNFECEAAYDSKEGNEISFDDEDGRFLGNGDGGILSVTAFAEDGRPVVRFALGEREVDVPAEEARAAFEKLAGMMRQDAAQAPAAR